MLKFEQLFHSREGTKWYPINVYDWKRAINFKSSDKKLLQSNFAYSMQYLEYLELQFDELDLPAVLKMMNIKSYIITGMGIIEGIFTDVLKTNNKWSCDEWEEYMTFESNRKKDKDSGNIYKTQTSLFKMVDKFDKRMDLDSMIKKIESSKLLTIGHDDFPVMKKLRQLRNRVHLQLGDNAYDHDYNNFNDGELELMRRILYNTLTCPELCINKKLFEFLNIE